MNATYLHQFLKNEGSTIISVTYKKNGKTHTLTFNPRDQKEGFRVLNSHTLKVRDFSIAKERGWGATRSVPIANITSLRSRGVLYS